MAENRRAPRTVVVGAEHGQRLDNFLLARLKGLPRSLVYRMVRRGEVRVNGARVQPRHRVERGDAVRLPPYRMSSASNGVDGPAAPTPLLRILDQRILYEDDELLVIDKPSGLAVHGGSGVAFGVVETLRRGQPGIRYELAHRLDRDTSGCLLLAKRRAMLLRLHAQFRAGRVRKRYDLIVAGRWPWDRRLVAEPLERYRLANGERRVRVRATGDPARTDFRVRRRADDATWLAARPRTGRTHQIRVHAACVGHPVLGDGKYGGRIAPGAPRLLLHASGVECEVDGVLRRFVAPLPSVFVDWWGSRGGGLRTDAAMPTD